MNNEPIFVPAKPEDKLPEGIWLPNRAERRAIKKNKKKHPEAANYIENIKALTKTKEFKQNLYKDLLENLQEKIKEKEKNDSIKGN